MKLLLSLAYYHIIYLILKLTRINPTFLLLENYSISIGPFTNPLPLLHKFSTPCYLLNTNTSHYFAAPLDSGVCFSPPNFIAISHPYLPIKVLKPWFTNFLRKKRTNPTNTIFQNTKQPPHTLCAFINPYSNTKLLNPFNNLTTLKKS
jgi:hypothetical protein